MFNNDERYWDITLLNKWFGISSVLFMAVTIWIYVDDNDDEFKDYQREFRKLQIEVAKDQLKQDSLDIAAEKDSYMEAVQAEQKIFDNKRNQMDQLEKDLKEFKSRHYSENMNYQSHKANVDALKYLAEAENAHSESDDHGSRYKDEYLKSLTKLDELRLIREETEIKISETEKNIKLLKSGLKKSKDNLSSYTKQYLSLIHISEPTRPY